MRNYMKKLFRKIIIKIQAKNELNVFVNEMSNDIEQKMKIDVKSPLKIDFS